LKPAQLALDPLPQRRAHEYAAEELRRLILLRVVSPGERLPSELELAEALDVSHVTIRAALRQLETDGLLEIRRGRLGGAYIRGVPALGDGPAQVGALQDHADSLRHALELRRLLEPEATAAATLRATAQDRARVCAAHQLVADFENAQDSAFMAADTAFHLELARTSGNPLFVESIERVLAALAPALQALPESGAWHNRSTVEHAAIVNHFLERDPAASRSLMAAHIAGTERAIEVLLSGLVVPARRSRRAGSAP
jgi:GntR family transcriptional repressor for pyruvate dehydrogenase complex